MRLSAVVQLAVNLISSAEDYSAWEWRSKKIPKKPATQHVVVPPPPTTIFSGFENGSVVYLLVQPARNSAVSRETEGWLPGDIPIGGWLEINT
jgi:hypothetical protein